MISGSSSITTFGSRAAAGTAATAVRSSVAHVSRTSAHTCTLTSSTTRLGLEFLSPFSAACVRGTDSVFIYKPAKPLPKTWRRCVANVQRGSHVSHRRSRRFEGTSSANIWRFVLEHDESAKTKTLSVERITCAGRLGSRPEKIHVGRHDDDDDDDDLRERLSPTERHFGKPSGLAEPRRPTTFTHLF